MPACEAGRLPSQAAERQGACQIALAGPVRELAARPLEPPMPGLDRRCEGPRRRNCLPGSGSIAAEIRLRTWRQGFSSRTRAAAADERMRST
jgi:hypothetical protein